MLWLGGGAEPLGLTPLSKHVSACTWQGGGTSLSYGASGLAELAFISSSAARWPEKFSVGEFSKYVTNVSRLTGCIGAAGCCAQKC